jgi:hypothetical protein
VGGGFDRVVGADRTRPAELKFEDVPQDDSLMRTHSIIGAAGD